MEAVTQLCQELVCIESLSGQEATVADLVEERARQLGYDDVVRDELGTVVAIRRGKGDGPTIVFDAHTDVVPATEPERWSSPPFAGVLRDGRVWGRGATDVKGSLAALLLAVAGLSRDEIGGEVIVSASIAEERMEGLALGRVLDRHRAARVVICEPTELQLGLGHKGRASLVIEAAGKAAHTSHPERGINAVYRMTEAISSLRRIVLPTDDLLGRGVMELVEIASEPFPGSSMVPYRCVARFDRRLVRGETKEGVLAEIAQALSDHDGVEARYHRSELVISTGHRFEEEVFHPPWAITPYDDIARCGRDALHDAGQEGAFFYAPYCTNGACSAGEREIPTVVYGAGTIADAHVVDEGVDVAQLEGAYAGYRALAKTLSVR